MSHPAVSSGSPARAGDQPAAGVDGRVTFARVVASEWLKFRTLRSTLVVLAAAVAAMVVFGAVLGHNSRDVSTLAPEDAAVSGPLQGYYMGQLLLSALGVLFVSGEYGTGMIRSTLAAVPRRIPVLAAKALVVTVVVGVAMVAASVVAFYVAQAFLSGYRPTASLSDPSVLRVVVGTGVYLTFIALLGSAAGWIIRSTPGALVGVVALILVLPVLLMLFGRSWGQHVSAYLPTGAGASFSTSVPVPDALAPWPGIAVMAAWVVVGLVFAGIRLSRSDA